ncbi:hypothetical protein NY2A_b387L [Paramecium bursaria Chlorella virus NY2A]|uniref:Uncharacterized protein b387L n=1 Tax=Paramecium bursaria Chlorella virus NY2A TaxID=46021 RepID=A7IWR2_PBCVN|nr:hypothetical protein NY2A_b387L [Paramecium bursaria Chlorella virus NY2A]YP_001498417.1 hypothetical protein AR158_c336L [Paramecium bursaria Chlorella virus AR158]ABT14786.1 hypothetical protein NY2A_b387L [Paramecium bursaria Chlorella virus NY2A]ABU43881.1 hypothetical protein AR158_c336L [Paramecium bursaria Chlorella virus AR158]
MRNRLHRVYVLLHLPYRTEKQSYLPGVFSAWNFDARVDHGPYLLTYAPRVHVLELLKIIFRRKHDRASRPIDQ